MRHVALLVLGLGLLLLQGNLFHALDDLSLTGAIVLWGAAVAIDVARTVSHAAGKPGTIATVRADLVLPATVLLATTAVAALHHSRVARPIPALVLPILLFMGVHEFSMARGAAVAFVLGYATDVVGIAPVGLYTFTFVATFVLARAAGVRLAAQTTWMQIVLVGAFSLLQSTMVLVLLAIFGRDAWVPRSLYPLALPHAVITAAIGPLIFKAARAAETAAGGAPSAQARVGTVP